MKSMFPKRDTKSLCFRAWLLPVSLKETKENKSRQKKGISLLGRFTAPCLHKAWSCVYSFLWCHICPQIKICDDFSTVSEEMPVSEVSVYNTEYLRKCHLVLWNLTFLCKFILMKSLAFSWGFLPSGQMLIGTCSCKSWILLSQL